MVRIAFVSSFLALSACSMFQSTPAPAPLPTPPMPPASGLPESSHEGADIRGVQQALVDKGYYKGRVDGVWGPQSDRAIRKFQRDNGLPVSGVVDSTLLLILEPQQTTTPGNT
jgi:peptidoglycan hydrolase-like protein with peptidoglycan-binding domain